MKTKLTYFSSKFTRRQSGGPKLNRAKKTFHPDGISTTISFHRAPLAGSSTGGVKIQPSEGGYVTALDRINLMK